MKVIGFPAYTTSTGWAGCENHPQFPMSLSFPGHHASRFSKTNSTSRVFSDPDEKVAELVGGAMAAGFKAFKMKVGMGIEDDARRATLMRSLIGWDSLLMMDANSVWGVDEAIANMEALAEFQPYWIEEPTSPDDILGHATIQRALVSQLTGTFKRLLKESNRPVVASLARRQLLPRAFGSLPCSSARLSHQLKSAGPLWLQDKHSINVATGEQISNKVMHKQYLQAGGHKILQTDVQVQAPPKWANTQPTHSGPQFLAQCCAGPPKWSNTQWSNTQPTHSHGSWRSTVLHRHILTGGPCWCSGWPG